MGAAPRPNRSSSATQTLALVFPDIVGPFYVEVVRAVERAAHEAGYHITIYGTSVRGAHQLLSSFEFVSKIDGMIVMTTALTDDEIRRLHSRGLPMVLLGRSAPVPSLDVIQTTNFDGAHMATVHLIRHGHRRIAFIAGPPDSPDASDRAAGYREALSEHQIHFDPALFVRGDFRQPSGSRAVATLLESSETPSAVFAANDEMATGAVQALRERGFNVPADVAVIGFDDIPLAAHMLPTLTTVRQPLQEFGTIAVQRLAAQISRETSSAETVVLPAALVLRQSCGCEPKILLRR